MELTVLKPEKHPQRQCGDCHECCMAFPLLPNKAFWPQGKKAHEPCKFLGCNGCSIYSQHRPAVCTDFKCGYLLGLTPWRPNETGVIVHPSELRPLLQGQLSRYQMESKMPPDWSDSDPGISLFETRPQAALGLDPRKIRYAFRRYHWRIAVVTTYGVDVLSDKRAFVRHHGNLVVLWKDTPAYVDQIVEWWMRN